MGNYGRRIVFAAIYILLNGVINAMSPKVSIIWLNYNSMRFIEIVKESLLALGDLNYDNYEVIIVDMLQLMGAMRS